MELVFIAFFCVIILSIRPVKNESGYNRELTDAIKGVAAIFIILHHFSWQVSNTGGLVVWFYREINLFAVGIFLLFSGFGLYKGIQSKHDCKKVIRYSLRIIFTYLFIFGIKILIDFAVGNIDYNVFFELFTLQMHPSNLWYIKGQLVCYILFVSGFLFFKKKKWMIAYIVSVMMIWIVIGITLGRQVINDAWYDTLLLFPIGIVLAIYEKQFVRLSKTYLVWMMFIITLITAIWVLIDKRWVYVMLSIWSVLMYLILTNYVYVKGKIWCFLGKHSLSIFIIHLVLIDYARKMKLNLANPIIILLIIGATVVFSCITDGVIHKLMDKIKSNRFIA